MLLSGARVLLLWSWGSFVHLHPAPSFFGQKRRQLASGGGPWVVEAWLVRQGVHLVLNSVAAFSRYLKATASVPRDALWVVRVFLVPCSRVRVSHAVSKAIKYSQSAVYPRAHDVRMYAALVAVFGNMFRFDIRA